MTGLLLALRRLCGDDAAGRADRALRAGRPAHEALSEAGAPGALVELFRAASPADLPAALEALAGPIERERERAARLRGAAVYPLLLAAAGIALSCLTLFGVLPGMSWVGDGASSWPAAIALAADVALLVALAALLRSPRPAFPFARSREQQERALVLSAAAVLSAQACTLPASLRAAAALASPGPLRDDAVALAGALERGEAQPGGRLLGALGRGLFVSSAARGAGKASLAALAELHQSVADGELPRLLLRAQLLSLGLGGAAVLLAGLGFITAYSSAMGVP
jgi:hypothetical protein